MISILFAYVAFSTYFAGTGTTGTAGDKIGDGNLLLFGYFAYIDVFVLAFGILLVTQKNTRFQRLDFYLGWILASLGLVLLQGLVADSSHAGYIATQIIVVLKPWIGTLGLWLFWMVIVTLAVVFVIEDMNILQKRIHTPSTLFESEIPLPPLSESEKIDDKTPKNIKAYYNLDDIVLDEKGSKKNKKNTPSQNTQSPDISIETPSITPTPKIKPNDKEQKNPKDSIPNESFTQEQKIKETPVEQKVSVSDDIQNHTPKTVNVNAEEDIFDAIFQETDSIIEPKNQSKTTPKIEYELADLIEENELQKETASIEIESKIESEPKMDLDHNDAIEMDIALEDTVEESLVECDVDHQIDSKESHDSQEEKLTLLELDEEDALDDNVLFRLSGKNVQIVDELEENTKLMQDIEQGEWQISSDFVLPKLEFLQEAPIVEKKSNEAEIDYKISKLLSKLRMFKIDGDVIRTYSGPLVTTFEFRPAPNVKVSKILGLQDDLAMTLKAETIRIQAPIPGHDVVGIEIPNETIETIYLRDILESDVYRNSASPLTVALGKDIVGKPFVTDIRKLPHLLIAGTTGSGKSVGINAMILSLLYRNDPDHLKLMLIDPKLLEFSIYNGIPHLLTPVITEAKKAIVALSNMVKEMERRYHLMAENRTKNIESYNEKVKRDQSEDPFPYIVVVIDELADLMMNGGKEVEFSIARLAQMARASGIHLIVATQRPSVDVVTGLIKANLPSRLSYRVGQKIDSKVILDAMGAESLLGKGDALFTPPGSTGMVRLHAPWSSEEEIDTIVEFIKSQREPQYDRRFLISEAERNDVEEILDCDLDELFDEAIAVVRADQKTSISYLQRKLQIGYNRSANIIEQMELKGILSPPNAKGNREIL